MVVRGDNGESGLNVVVKITMGVPVLLDKNGVDKETMDSGTPWEFCKCPYIYSSSARMMLVAEAHAGRKTAGQVLLTAENKVTHRCVLSSTIDGLHVMDTIDVT